MSLLTATPKPPLFFTLAGLINQDMTARLFGSFAGGIRDGFNEIHLLVQSTGGFIGDGIAMHNYLSNLPIKLITYNVGHVASIAVVIFLAGQRRLVAESATFMIHRPLNTSPVRAADAIGALANSLRIDEDRCESLLKSKIVSMPTEKWAAYAKNDLTFCAKDAVSYGAAHEIGLFSPPVGAPIYNI